ncbi:MAG TPA: MFS transporter [Acidimicrobiales bacterium]|nr:MFS transporter [Acidimicrobiales bacterium]
MGVRERSDRFRRLARSAIADLFDQRRPFGRLALTHVLMTAGDTLFAVSLAGSLFFSISPTAAKDKVLLYLLLTMGPFAVVAPALGPVIDRSRGARRGMVVASALGRAALCPFLARDIHSLLLFPEAFAMLVLSKVYLVTKGALVPEMAALGMLDEAGRNGGRDPQGTDPGPGPDGPGWDPASPPGAAHPPAAGAGRRAERTPPYGTPVIHVEDPGSGSDGIEPDLATLNARLGLLASLSGLVFALPAVAVLKLGGAPSVLWVAVGVFAAAVVAGTRLPVAGRPGGGRAGRRRSRQAAVARRPTSVVSAMSEVLHAPDTDPTWAGDEEDLAAFRPIAGTEVVLALMPMSVLKALMGFLTFLFAFALRRESAPTWWFGLVLGGLTAGALIGVLSVSAIRRVLTEQQMLSGSLLLVAAFATLGAFFPVRWLQAVVAMAVGAASAVAKPSFDALVQRHVRESNQGRAFARFETRFQLMWVVGSFVPVVLALPIGGGDLIMAVVAAVGAVSYMSSRRAVRLQASTGQRLTG